MKGIPDPSSPMWSSIKIGGASGAAGGLFGRLLKRPVLFAVLYIFFAMLVAGLMGERYAKAIYYVLLGAPVVLVLLTVVVGLVNGDVAEQKEKATIVRRQITFSAKLMEAAGITTQDLCSKATESKLTGYIDISEGDEVILELQAGKRRVDAFLSEQVPQLIKYGSQVRKLPVKKEDRFVFFNASGEEISKAVKQYSTTQERASTYKVVTGLLLIPLFPLLVWITLEVMTYYMYRTYRFPWVGLVAVIPVIICFLTYLGVSLYWKKKVEEERKLEAWQKDMECTRQ